MERMPIGPEIEETPHFIPEHWTDSGCLEDKTDKTGGKDKSNS